MGCSSLQITNGAGSVFSPVHYVLMPTLSPEGLSQPSVEALDAFSIRVEWSAPDRLNGLVDQFLVCAHHIIFFVWLCCRVTPTCAVLLLESVKVVPKYVWLAIM